MRKEKILEILENAKDGNGAVPMRLVRTAFDKLPEPCEDTISRQAAIDALECINGVEDVLRSLPTVQPEPKEGHWIQYDKRFPWRHHYKCSECGNYLDFSGVNAGRGEANYCPNCGADMRGERDG